MQTNLDDLFDDISSQEGIILDKDNVHQTIFDLYLPEEDRLRAIEKYHDYFKDDIISVIIDLNTRYLLTETTLMKRYLESICYKADIVPELKIEIAKSLTGKNNDDNTGYDIIKHLLQGPDYDFIPTPCFVDALTYWMQAPKEIYEDFILSSLYDFSLDYQIDCDYRFRTLVSIHKDHPWYALRGLYVFLHANKGVWTMYKILSSQVLLQDEHRVKEVCNTLLTFCEDDELDYNLRADSADTLLHLGIDDLKERARDIIIALGGRGRTVYDNQQNVHAQEVENSVEEIILAIRDTPISITFNVMREKIQEIVKEKEYNEEYINVALNRIELDQTLYSVANLNLKRLAMIVWNYIHINCEESLEELHKRFIEELIDMANTCSSGHVSRLCSVLSGFTDHNVRISFEDQILANLQARLIKKLGEVDLTEDEKIEISTEFLSSAEFEKPHFMKFFREHISDIKEELWKEYCNSEIDGRLISDEDFDTLLRLAIIRFTYS
jgi:hypothetical protein